jgi:hypothetical protein
MTTGFFSRLFGGKKVDLESIRAEIRRIERELGEKFDAQAFQNGEWFLDNFEGFVQRYRNVGRIRALESTYPNLSEDQLSDLLMEESVRTATLAGGATGAVISAAELSGLVTGLLSLGVGAMSALAEMIYLVNLQLQLTFDIAALNDSSPSIEEPEEMFVTFASALGYNMLDLRGEGDVTEMALLVKSAACYHLFKRATTQLGKMLVRQLATKYAVPVLSIGIGAYFDRNRTEKVGQAAKSRFGKLRRMKERIFDLRSRIGDRQKEALLAAMGYLHSDGLLTLEEVYLLRELARSLQATALWQQIAAGEIELSSEEFVRTFRDPVYYDQRELLLSVLQVVSEAKMQPNDKEAEFLRKLIAS